MSYYHTGLKLGFCGECKIKIQPRVGKLNKTVIVDIYTYIFATKIWMQWWKAEDEGNKKWINYCPGKKCTLGIGPMTNTLTKPATIWIYFFPPAERPQAVWKTFWEAVVVRQNYRGLVDPSMIDIKLNIVLILYFQVLCV